MKECYARNRYWINKYRVITFLTFRIICKKVSDTRRKTCISQTDRFDVNASLQLVQKQKTTGQNATIKTVSNSLSSLKYYKVFHGNSRDIILSNMALAQGNHHQANLDMVAFQAASKLFDPNTVSSGCYSDYQV